MHPRYYIKYLACVESAQGHIWESEIGWGRFCPLIPYQPSHLMLLRWERRATAAVVALDKKKKLPLLLHQREERASLLLLQKDTEETAGYCCCAAKRRRGQACGCFRKTEKRQRADVELPVTASDDSGEERGEAERFITRKGRKSCWKLPFSQKLFWIHNKINIMIK